MKISIAPEVREICTEYQLPEKFPQTSLAQAEKIGNEIGRGKKDGRRDLRSLPLITIDGSDAKDFDDSVHCERKADRFKLVVAIADAAAFVPSGSLLDEEARKRANSVYFPGIVMPMLPPQLSEDWCSLCPDKDRLGLACSMEIDERGRVSDYEFFECLLRSHRRFTYEEAQEKIDGNSSSSDKVLRSLRTMKALVKKLLQAREARGSLQLELSKTAICEKNGYAVGMRSESRMFSSIIIEECMLAANTCAADFLFRNRRPFLYRGHAKPEAEKTQRLKWLLREHDIRVGDLSDPKNMQAVIDQCRLKEPIVANALMMNVLRTLQRAEYTPKKIAHYGLGYEKYAHFTSPIRRYPDLLVHRELKAVLQGKPPKKGLTAELESIGAYCSEKEMASDRAALDLTARLINKLHRGEKGKVLDGAIVGMAKSGFFVQCAGGLDGMVKYSSIGDDYYEVDRHRVKAVGKRSHRSLHIGMRVSVSIADIDDETGRCRMHLVD